MDRDNFETLKDLFITDPTSAIERSQQIIISVSNFDSYKEFISSNLKNQHMSTCQNEWTETQACIFCKNCAKLNESCVCIQCFFKGDHKGHDYIINRCIGNCDCGDESFWKRSGFCSEHHGLESDECPEKYLDEKLRTTLVDVIFKAAFLSLEQFTTEKTENASKILQFVSSFLQFGDGFRRLISISLTEKFDLEEFMLHILEFSSSFNNAFEQFLGGLVNDKLFIRNFSIISYNVIFQKVIHDIPTVMSSKSNVNYIIWDDFWFHSFAKHCFDYNFEKFNWDWVTFFIKTLSYFKEVLSFIGNDNYKRLPHILIMLANRVKNATQIQPNEQTQQFFDQLFSQVFSCGSQSAIKENRNDTIVTASFNQFTPKHYYFPVYHYQISFFDTLIAFKNKPNLKFDSLFEQLEKVIDISPIFMIGMNSIGNNNVNENDKFISKYINKVEGSFDPSNYKSFHNGASFFLTNPLFESLNYLFRIDDLSRIKIARFLSTEKYQNLRVKLGIITLKSILSFLCCRQSITRKVNKGLIFLCQTFSDEDSASNNYSKFVALFQLLIGLQCNEKKLNDEFGLKEFFAFEIAREIGIFDDFSAENYEDENVDEEQKQMIFTFLFISLLLVTDRKLFNFDGMTFLKEQIIFSLKKGIHSIEKLDKANCYNDIDPFQHTFSFNDALMEVAKLSRNNETNENNNNENENDDDDQNDKSSKQVMFYLKDEIEYNPISAINSINDQMTIMNNDISKQSDKLLSIPSFEPEETFFFKKQNQTENTDGLNVHLKQFLFTPTVLAIVYDTLRNAEKSELNNHLAMNILVLISKFVKEEKNSGSFNESTEIHYDNLVDLISKLKSTLYNYHVDEEGNATIENTLNPTSFVSLLKLKISLKDLPPKSFVDLLLERGKLGHNVLQQISTHVQIDFVGKEKEDKQVDDKSSKEEKRKRANKLKEQIMNQYKDMIANYNNQKSADSIDAISSMSASGAYNAENEVCSICSTYKGNEILTLPLYLYRTKLPFVIDKPPITSKDTEGHSIDDPIYDFDQDSEEVENNDKDDDDDDDVPQISRESLMPFIYSSFPQLENTEGLTQEQLGERENIIEMIYQSLARQIIEDRITQKKSKRANVNLKNYIKNEKEKFIKSSENRQFKRCTVGANFVLQFNLCQHPVHQKCAKGVPYTCPVDRSIKNSFLPSIDLIPIKKIFKDLKTFELYPEDKDSLHYSIINSITSFIDSFSSFFECVKDQETNIFIELVKSISALISTFEIRLRSLPDCLDSEKTTLLARNLFLTTWYAYRIKGKPQMNEKEDESKLTLIQRLIKKLIESDTIEISLNKESEFKQIILDLLNSNDLNKLFNTNDSKSKEKLICLFLRRCCLAEHFLLNAEVSSDLAIDIIDWDEVLSSLNLIQRYGFKLNSIDFEKGEEFDFKPFTFSNLPKEFLRFCEKPFCFPVEKIYDYFYFNMLDYNYLINHYDEVSGEIINDNEDDVINNYKNNLFNCNVTFFGKKHSPALFLYIGKDASQVALIEGPNLALLDVFYLDKYGCTDIGYKRSQPLFLNEELLDKCFDSVLSGNFASFLKNNE